LLFAIIDHATETWRWQSGSFIITLTQLGGFAFAVAESRGLPTIAILQTMKLWPCHVALAKLMCPTLQSSERTW
jgi:hypothetical protein